MRVCGLFEEGMGCGITAGMGFFMKSSAFLGAFDCESAFFRELRLRRESFQCHFSALAASIDGVSSSDLGYGTKRIAHPANCA
ncbi:MAG: hypothetical protein QW087_07640 [Methanomassiliicoccales archaeon]